MFRKLLSILFLALAGHAHAFVSDVNTNGNVQHWDLVNFTNGVSTNVVNTNTHAIRFFIASDAYSTTNTTAELNAVRACFAQWQAIPGTSLKFEDAGLIAPVSDVDTEDHTNVVFWIKNGTLLEGGTFDMSGALGLTFSSFSSDNVLLEADIVLNGTDYPWFTDISDTNNQGYFVEGTLLHEIGHYVGLHHSPVGGATMLAQGGNGSSATQNGLSSDEIAAAHYLYPASPQTTASLATLRGSVTNNLGTAAFAAAVMAESSAGNIIAGTVTATNGHYEIPALPPGNYQVRVTPLDPSGTGYRLINGADIGADFASAYTDFRPSTNRPITLTAGVTNTADFIVTTGAPPFHVSHLRPPTSNPLSFGALNAPISIRPGQSNMTVGVYGPTLPTNGTTLSITGDGVSLGAITYATNIFGSLNGVFVVASISSNATPGLRSFILTHTNDNLTTYANGFLEVSPLVMDNNFDGLDDLFQRQYFPLFTSAQAAPNADPDGDGYTNLAEYIAGSNPTNSASFLQIQSITQSTTNTTISWNSAPGKKYLVLSRPQFVTAPWTTNGAPIVATNTTAQFVDSPIAGSTRFYRIQAVP